MSENEIVCAIRGEVPSLEGEDFYDGIVKAYSSLTDEVGLEVPDNKDAIVDQALIYDHNNGFRVVCDVQPDDYRFGIDYVLLKGYAYNAPSNDCFEDVADILGKVDSMVSAGVDRDSVHITSYVFYNGTDEPIDFDRGE